MTTVPVSVHLGISACAHAHVPLTSKSKSVTVPSVSSVPLPVTSKSESVAQTLCTSPHHSVVISKGSAGDNDTRISVLTTAQRLLLGPSPCRSAIGALPSVSLSVLSLSV